MREQGFGCVISLLPSPHNLHNYDEFGVAYRHRPFGAADDARAYLSAFYPEIHGCSRSGTKVVLHGEEVGDRIAGLVGGYIRWAGMVPDGPAGDLDHRAHHRPAARPASAAASVELRRSALRRTADRVRRHARPHRDPGPARPRRHRRAPGGAGAAAALRDRLRPRGWTRRGRRHRRPRRHHRLRPLAVPGRAGRDRPSRTCCSSGSRSASPRSCSPPTSGSTPDRHDPQAPAAAPGRRGHERPSRIRRHR